jgi:hypothetical protein
MEKTTNTVRSVGGQKLSFKSSNGRGESKENIKFCPLSRTKGIQLQRITMTNHVHPVYWSQLTETGFYFCGEQECPVIYFNNKVKRYFGQSEVRVAVMHKMKIRTEGRPMCYCTGILEEQVLYELLIKKCCDSLQDIQKYTGANQGKNCKISNPTGRCCGSLIKEVIDWVKESQPDIARPLLDEADAHSAAITENADINHGP